MGDAEHKDRNCRGSRLCLNRRLRAYGNYELDVAAGDELCGIGPVAFGMPLYPTAFD